MLFHLHPSHYQIHNHVSLQIKEKKRTWKLLKQRKTDMKPLRKCRGINNRRGDWNVQNSQLCNKYESKLLSIRSLPEPKMLEEVKTLLDSQYYYPVLPGPSTYIPHIIIETIFLPCFQKWNSRKMQCCFDKLFYHF